MGNLKTNKETWSYLKKGSIVFLVILAMVFIGYQREDKAAKELTTAVSLDLTKYDSGFTTAQPKESNTLQILHASPQGPTSAPHEAERIVIIFDRPMVALQALSPEDSSQPEKSPAAKTAGASVESEKLQTEIKIKPATPGHWRWLGSRTLVFTPAQRFPYATSVKVTIPAGTTALDGSRLPYEYSWNFETIRPRLLQHFPSNGQRWLQLQPEILLIFNQPMDKNEAAKYISWEIFPLPENDLSASDKPQLTEEKEKVNFKIAYPPPERLKEQGFDLPAEYALLLTLDRPAELKPESACLIKINKGLPGKEGPLGMSQDYSFTFETFRRFRFEGLVEFEAERPEEAAVSFQLMKPIPPDQPLRFRFSNPVPYKELVSKIKINPAVEIPDYYFEWEEADSSLDLSLPLEPETRYSVTIPADLADAFGNKLGQSQTVSLATGSFPPAVSMTTGYGVIEAYAEPGPRYPLSAINQESVFIQATRVQPEALIPLLSQPGLFRSDKPFLPRTGFYQVEKDYPLKLARNQRKTVPINLRELNPDFRRGLVFLQVDTKNPEQRWDRYLKVLLQITELGISAKFSAENNTVWVTELKTGLPAKGVRLELRDETNVVRWQGETDASGKAETPGWKKLGLPLDAKRYDAPKIWILARRGEDVAFTSSDWDYGVDPFRFNLPVDWRPEPARYQGYIFSERGIYRAGEEVHIKGLIREKIKGEWQIPAGAPPLNLEIHNPVGKVVFKGRATLDEFGSFQLDFPTADDSSLGLYELSAKLPSPTPGKKEAEAEFSGTFRVEAFRPAEFEVLLRSAQETFIFGDEYKAMISANYFFGGAMAGQGVSWSLRLNRTSFSPPGHKGFIFGNQIDWDEEEETYAAESRLLTSGESKLNAEGKLSLRLPLVPEKEKDSVVATLEATVTAPNRTSISNRIQTLVHRGEFYIGLRPSTSFLKKGEPISVEVIAAAPDGQILPNRQVKIKLMRRTWHSARQASVGGRYRWRSEPEDTEVASREITTEAQPVSLSFQPDKSGFYFFLAAAEDNRHNSITTTTYFYVTGADYVPWEQREDDTIELVPDEATYRPGSVSRILVKSPYERAKALITIEREHILEAKVVDIIGTASFIEIPIRQEHIPNIFVSVLLVQGRTAPSEGSAAAEDLGVPGFKIGYVNLAVDPAERRLEVKIENLQPEYRPRDKVNFKVKVASSTGPAAGASVALACVDLGVLNLIGYETPDPFSFFYGQRPLSVRTSETRIHIVSQRQFGEKGEEPGGGGEERMMAMAPGLAEIMLRGDFKSTAYWTPSVITDDNGEATISFTLPDNLTTFRIMAVAQTKDSRFGRGEATFRVAKKLMLQPSLPRFCRVGDNFEAGVVVHNLTLTKGEVILSLDVSGIGLLDKNKEQRANLQPGESRELLFRFKAEKPGLAIFAFRAKMGQETDGLQIKLPVQLPRPTEAVGLSGEISGEEEASVEERLRIPEKVFPEQSFLELQTSSSALVGLKGSLDSLADYPYACLEQRVSSILPYLVAKRVLLDFKLTPLSEKEIDQMIRLRLKEIAAYQKEGGGFAAWPDASQTSPFLTCYAMFALIKAREAGFTVDPDIFNRGIDYLLSFLRTDRQQARQPYSLRPWNSTRAYALYILSLLRRPQPSLMEKVYADKERLSLFGKALLLKAIHHSQILPQAKEALIKEFLNKIKVTSGEAHFEDDEGRDGGWIYSSNGRTTALILQALIEAGQEHPSFAAMARWLVNRQMALMKGSLASTQENFYLFYALNAFYSTRESVPADFIARLNLAGQSLLEEKFTAETREIKQAKLRLSDLTPKGIIMLGREYPLTVEKKGPGSLYYGVRLKYAPATASAARDEGIAVVKRIEPLAASQRGGSPNEIKAGSLVVVTLEIAVPQEYLYVVVDDPLPAGFEAVNPAFKTESEEATRRLEALVAAEAASPRPWWQGFSHVERHDDRVILFADSLTPGLHVHRYLARALNYGLYVLPGTKAEQMYAPDVFGRSPEVTIKIVR